MYRFIRGILFLADPEKVHYAAMNILKWICAFSGGKKLITRLFAGKPSQLPCSVLGMRLVNPVGLGAGFDKNARYLNELEALGFGFVEVGTVTPLPQAGNEKPRLFRLTADRALLNRMGFNNDGVKAVAGRLGAWKNKVPQKPTAGNIAHRLIVGGNIGKNKQTANEDAWKDYEACFHGLVDVVDYFVVNVSSPNTPGLRELQEKESLRKILSHLQVINRQQSHAKPLLLKIAPDLSWQQIDDVIDLAMEIKLDGLVATNTTIDRSGLQTAEATLRSIGAGGVSGQPLKTRSTEIVQYIHHKTNGQLPVIASGGIFSGEDAREKMRAGASLVQVWTGFVYEGPGIVQRICRTLRAI